jgi:oligopeptide/dipeptide ABC transporter ATP-binding protein
LEVTDLAKYYSLGGSALRKSRAHLKAVDNVSFTLNRRESIGLVGESGCGKTTLGWLILRLLEPSNGRIVFDGQDFADLHRKDMRSLRKRMQIIFQDPYSSLDPRMKVESIVTEPLRADRGYTKAQRKEIAVDLLRRVGLRAADLNKYPHEFSGGQRQRIGIARCLGVRPELIVADEPVSALDVSIQAQIINLMLDLKQEFGISYIFITHDLSIVEYICDWVAIMYLGTIVELSPIRNFILSPLHPYTQALLEAVPLPDPGQPRKLFHMEGNVPNPINPPSGCAFHPRCQHAFHSCHIERPPLTKVAPSHSVACWLHI